MLSLCYLRFDSIIATIPFYKISIFTDLKHHLTCNLNSGSFLYKNFKVRTNYSTPYIIVNDFKTYISIPLIKPSSVLLKSKIEQLKLSKHPFCLLTRSQPTLIRRIYFMYTSYLQPRKRTGPNGV